MNSKRHRRAITGQRVCAVSRASSRSDAHETVLLAINSTGKEICITEKTGCEVGARVLVNLRWWSNLDNPPLI